MVQEKLQAERDAIDNLTTVPEVETLLYIA
jgi:hypothetical protein